jgi:hypothetical protein
MLPHIGNQGYGWHGWTHTGVCLLLYWYNIHGIYLLFYHGGCVCAERVLMFLQTSVTDEAQFDGYGL